MAENRHELLVIGFGTVGQGFFELLKNKKNALGLENVKISEIADLKYGHIRNPASDLLDNLKKTENNVSVKDILKDSSCDIVCEFTWADYDTGGPAYDYIKSALALGKDVITTNKAPIALHFDELTRFAGKQGVALRFKGTVMSGTPSFNILTLLPGVNVTRFRAILNGTSNYILNEMTYGKSMNAALKEAQDKGYAEADTANDLDGFDAAAKCLIVSKVLGWKHELSGIETTGIRYATNEEAKAGMKLMAYADPKTAYVKPLKLKGDDIMRSVVGVANAIEFDTDTLGKIYSIGPGTGRLETAQAALTDLVEIVS